ncbi:MAG: hypothetical protein KKB50_03705 [Planctomycetes bacterium]|nr:hypothetical protein [Planctomycetota bacterium]
MRPSPAFTIVELIVVITVIVIILAIAIPGLSAMTAEARFSAAQQSINGVLTRAHITALADMSITAVRFMPGRWDRVERMESQEAGDEQHAVTYKYVCSTDQFSGSNVNVAFSERFERLKGSAPLRLSSSTWVAPVEALATETTSLVGHASPYGNFGADFVLAGVPQTFKRDAGDPSFFNADDFLIVFDPRTGVRGAPEKSQLVGADLEGPGNVVESTNIQRYNFSGIVIYKREPFLEVAGSANGADRQLALRRFGRPFFVHRHSGALVMGVQRADSMR